VGAEEYGRFLCDVFDEWRAYDLGRVRVQLFEETARVMAGGEAGLCWMAPVCGRVLVLERDGAVYSCDHFVRPEHRLGNITEKSLVDMADSPEQRAFGDKKRAALTEECRACKYLPYCNGGCPKDRSADGVNCLCRGLKRFFAHAENAARKA
jgi:uncharacterized protein